MLAVVFLSDTSEEYGTPGVSSYLDQLSSIELSKINYIVNIDMVSYDSTHNGVMELRSGDGSSSCRKNVLIKDIIQAYSIDLRLKLVVGRTLSDEVPFHEKRISGALQIQNTDSGNRNPNDHSQNDSIDHVNPGFLFDQVKVVTAVADNLLTPISYLHRIHLPVISIFRH